MRLAWRPASHAVGTDVPASHQWPRGDGSHAVAPLLRWYVPASHGAHSEAPLALLTEPAAHGVGCVAPKTQKCPSLHGWQSDAFALPSAAE